MSILELTRAKVRHGAAASVRAFLRNYAKSASAASSPLTVNGAASHGQKEKVQVSKRHKRDSSGASYKLIINSENMLFVAQMRIKL